MVAHRQDIVEYFYSINHMPSQTQSQIQTLLDGSGITLNGTNPWDIQVKNEAFYNRVLTQGSLGFGESYMDGWWECDAIDELITRLFSIDVTRRLKTNWKEIGLLLASSLMNRQAGKRAYKIGEEHYDVGNELYTAMLDKRMVYTCGYWKDATDLDSAQDAKLDLVCKKIGLKSGDRVLDIGCGWGSFAKFAAEKYGASVVGITVSREQVERAREICAGFPIEIRLEDYRDVSGQFDKIISLGMFEHVGSKNYHAYMEVARRCLTDDGMFLLHTIGGNRSVASTDPWIGKYIFPNSMLPSIAQIGQSIEGLLVMEDWHNFSADYDKTLMAWFHNFDTRWPEIQKAYGERFCRMWKYYLLASAGSFRSRRNQLWP